MKLLAKALKLKNPQKMNEEERGMLERIGTDFDFTSRSMIAPLVEYCKK